MNPRRCPSCGANLAGDTQACLLCGASLSEDTAPAEPVVSPGTRRASALDVEVLAFAISAGRQVGVLSEGAAEALQAELTAVDVEGTWWTFLADSRQWFRSRGERWVASDAPDEVHVRAELFRRLQETTRDTLEQVAQQRRQGRICPTCGTPLRPGKRFCVRCGASVTAASGGEA